MVEDIPEPYPPLNPNQQALVDRLSSEQVEEIDRLLIQNASCHWRKVAMLISKTLMELEYIFVGVPDIYYAERIKNLVESGRLEAQGNLNCMRFSEVRLPAADAQCE